MAIFVYRKWGARGWLVLIAVLVVINIVLITALRSHTNETAPPAFARREKPSRENVLVLSARQVREGPARSDQGGLRLA